MNPDRKPEVSRLLTSDVNRSRTRPDLEPEKPGLFADSYKELLRRIDSGRVPPSVLPRYRVEEPEE